MSCNVLHLQCWQQARWIGAGGARNMNSGETVGKKAQIGLSRTAPLLPSRRQRCSLGARKKAVRPPLPRGCGRWAAAGAAADARPLSSAHARKLALWHAIAQ